MPPKTFNCSNSNCPVVEAILDYAKDNLVMFNIFIKAFINFFISKECLLTKRLCISGSLCKEVHEGWEDHQDGLHCQLWRPAGALHGLLAGVRRGDSLSLSVRPLLTHLWPGKEKHKGENLISCEPIECSPSRTLCTGCTPTAETWRMVCVTDTRRRRLSASVRRRNRIWIMPSIHTTVSWDFCKHGRSWQFISADTAMYRGGPEPGLAAETETEVQSEALLTGSYPSLLNRPCLLHNGNYGEIREI